MRTSPLLIAGLLLITSATVQAQSKTTVRADIPKSALLKDGAFRKNGLTMRLQAGEVSRLSAPLVLENGAVIRSNGIIVSRDGSRQLLPENHAVNMQGSIVLLRDDMLTPRAIAQQAQAVTGSTGETHFALASESGAAGSTTLPPRLTAKLLRTEQRLAMLEEMTTRLEQRTKVKSTATAPLDQQLSQIDRQLQQAVPSMEAASDGPTSDAPSSH
jgi:hypothetical protein